MKKLLALILCVMMFVAVIPTAAFAVTPYTEATSGGDFKMAWASSSYSKTLVKSNKDAIDTMLKGIAADQAVFGTVSAIDSLVDSLANSFFEDIDSVDTWSKNHVKTYHDDLVDNTKAFLRGAIGDSINKYMKEHEGVWSSELKNAAGEVVKDAGGNVVYTYNPEKYINTFATAASKALTSKNAQKGLEAFITSMAMIKVLDDVDDQADDLYEAIKDWEDGSEILKAYGFKEIGDKNFFIPTAFVPYWDVDDGGAYPTFILNES